MSDSADDLYDQHVRIDAAFLASARAMASIDPLYWSIDTRQSPADFDAAFKPYSRPQRLVYAMVWHCAETGNGGHDQFFWNSTGIVWRDALEGYEAAGISDAHAILREAADRLGGDPPLEKTARCELFRRLDPVFDDLDDRFYGMLNADTACLDDRIMAYVRANGDAFAFDGMVRKPRGFD
jgi:Domain of unknown function (DUF4375)